MSYEVTDDKRERGIEYVSKSRVKTMVTCPRKFFYTYWCEERPPDKFVFKKGRRIHRVYETFHENLKAYVEHHGERPRTFAGLLDDWHDYHQWLDPHIGNFFLFEERRWDLAVEHADSSQEALDLWLPKEVEYEVWLGGAPSEEYVEARGEPDLVLDDQSPPVGDAPWMGLADVLVHAATVPGIEATEGYVVLDYKTGKTQDEQYRDEGIYLEGEYYGWLMEQVFDIAGVAGYYPQNDDLVVSPFPSFQRRHVIMDAVEGMFEDPEPENYRIEEQPLCHYGHGKCDHYDECPSTWGTKGGAGWHNKADEEADA